jgi:serine protease AprX
MALEARVVALALGTDVPGSAQDALSAAVDQVVDSGIPVCVAAGLAASGGSASPATAARALVVGACETCPGPGVGEGGLAAPGSGVTAARAYGTTVGTPAGEQYVTASGPSAAAAHVAGICALLLEAVPEATPEALAEALRAGGRALPDGRRSVSALAALAALRETARRR